jgi:hypothetical protein
MAVADRPNESGLTYESVVLDPQAIQRGNNVMAIHVLNGGLEDNRVFIDPIIEWVEVILERQLEEDAMSLPVYRLLPVPTPGGDNVARPGR